MFDKDKIVGFLAVRHFPHPNNSKIKKCSRLVILPDYQGVGLGTHFLNVVASFYDEYDFNITTTAKNLIHALNKSEKWSFQRYGRWKPSNTMDESFLKNSRSHVKTATFRYIK